MAHVIKIILKWILVCLYIQVVLILLCRPLLVSMENTRADYFMSIGKISLAITHYKRVFWVDPNNLYALIWCGYAYEECNQFNIAQNYYLRAIKYHSNRNEGYYFLATLYMREHQYKTAKKYFEKAAQYPGSFKNQVQQANSVIAPH